MVKVQIFTNPLVGLIWFQQLILIHIEPLFLKGAVEPFHDPIHFGMIGIRPEVLDPLGGAVGIKDVHEFTPIVGLHGMDRDRQHGLQRIEHDQGIGGRGGLEGLGIGDLELDVDGSDGGAPHGSDDGFDGIQLHITPSLRLGRIADPLLLSPLVLLPSRIMEAEGGLVKEEMVSGDDLADRGDGRSVNAHLLRVPPDQGRQLLFP